MEDEETITKVNGENLLITKLVKQETLIGKATLEAQKKSLQEQIAEIDNKLAFFK